MAEYIERKALFEAIEDFRLNETMSKHLTHEDCETARNAIERAQMIIERIPADDVAPVRHGKWIKDNNSYYPDDYYCVYYDWNCSICGKTVNDRNRLPKFCPECGAKMDGEENDKT